MEKNSIEQLKALKLRDDKFKQFMSDNNISDINIGVALFKKHEEVEALTAKLEKQKNLIGNTLNLLIAAASEKQPTAVMIEQCKKLTQELINS